MLLTLTLLVVQTCNALSCTHCSETKKAECTPVRALNCTTDIVLDVCKCCPVCSKGEGEKCGGSYGLKGRCTSGLACYSYEDQSSRFSNAPIGICGKYNIDKDQNCLLFEYDGCDLVDDFCDCRKEMACINPFEYQSREQCDNELHQQPGECQKVKCRKIKHHKNVAECPSDSKLITGRWTDDGCCPVENRFSKTSVKYRL